MAARLTASRLRALPASRGALVAASLALLAGLVALVVAGCGGGSSASSSTPVDQLLRETFSNGKSVKSGVLDLTLRMQAQGSPQVQGPATVHLTGPFQSRGAGKLPAFHFDAAVQGGGQSFSAGATSTGDKGYLSFEGSNYVVADNVFAKFRQGYEQAQARAKSKSGQSLAALGIDPRRWLTNARNVGEGKVGDADVIRITGGVNVPKLLDDVNTVIDRTRSLDPGALQGRAPQKLTEQEKQQAARAVKRVAVEVDTGKDDKILRRVVLNLDLHNLQGTGATSASVRLDMQLKDVNQGQDIAAPANARPFSELLNGLGALGLGGAGAGTGSGGASADNLQKYSDCIRQAGNDAAKARKCADLLTP